jgi:hypothetical protein
MVKSSSALSRWALAWLGEAGGGDVRDALEAATTQEGEAGMIIARTKQRMIAGSAISIEFHCRYSAACAPAGRRPRRGLRALRIARRRRWSGSMSIGCAAGDRRHRPRSSTRSSGPVGGGGSPRAAPRHDAQPADDARALGLMGEQLGHA